MFIVSLFVAVPGSTISGHLRSIGTWMEFLYGNRLLSKPWSLWR